MQIEEKPSKNKIAHSAWIFWLTHDSRAMDIHSFSTFYKCAITEKQILTEGQPPIRINDITECDHALITRFGPIHTKLVLLDSQKIEIAVTDPFYPNFKSRNNATEAWAFQEIINALIAGQIPDHPQSPYVRAKHRAKFYPEEVTYNPHVSPLTYYHQYRKPWSGSEIISRVTITLLVSIVLLTVMMLLAQYLGI